MRVSGIGTQHPSGGVNLTRIRVLIKWWPLIVGAMAIAVITAWWAHSHQRPSYSSTARLVVVPLAQWDETFLGTDLVRDAGDATRTAPTLAAQLKSDHYAAVTAGRLGGNWTAGSVSAAVSVSTPGEINIIDITAQSSDPETARRLASEFATAVAADRWQNISAQLDTKIAALRSGGLILAGDQQGANPTAAEQAGRLQTLVIVRDGNADPTVRISPAGRAVRAPGMSLTVTLILAALGGACLGVLSAAALEYLRYGAGRLDAPTRCPAPRPIAYSANGSSHADAKSR